MKYFGWMPWLVNPISTGCAIVVAAASHWDDALHATGFNHWLAILLCVLWVVYLVAFVMDVRRRNREEAEVKWRCEMAMRALELANHTNSVLMREVHSGKTS